MRNPALFLLMILSVVSASAVEVTSRAAYTWTENLGRASGATDFRDAATYSADVSLGSVRQLESGLLLRPQLTASYSLTPEYELLDSGEFGPRLAAQKKFGLGPTAPVLSADAALLGRFGRLDEADAFIAKGGVTFSKRLTDVVAINLRGEARQDWSRGDVYDVNTQDVIASLVLDPHPRLRFTVGVGRRWGLFVVGASAARFGGAITGALGPEVEDYYKNRTPFSTTDVFAPGWISYRVRGESDYCFFDLSPALTDRTSLSVRYERVKAVNIVDIEYLQDIFRVAVVHVF